MERTSTFNRRILLLILVSTGLSVMAWFGLDYFNNRPLHFDRTRWLQAEEEGDWRVRSRMATDLVNHNKLIGQTRGQLIALLGDSEKYSDATDQQLYYLIREDWEGIDPIRRDHLLITTSQDGSVVTARIIVFKKTNRERFAALWASKI